MAEHEERLAASEGYEGEHGPQARRRKAQEREAARAARTPGEQLALLYQRPGDSWREQDRLWRQINEGDKPKPFERRDATNAAHTAAKNVRAGRAIDMAIKQEKAAMGRQGKRS